MIKTLKVSAREVKTDKNSFIACSTKIGDRYFKIKFVKDCMIQPKKRGLYDITIDTAKCSIQRGEKYIDKNGFDRDGQSTIWVKEAESIRLYTEEELSAINENKFKEILDIAEDSSIDDNIRF